MTQSRFHASDLSLSRKRHRGFATLAALALVLAGAGCGGGGGQSGGDGRLSKSEYEARIQNDGREITDAFGALRTQPKSLPELASKLDRAQDKLRAVTDDLDSITPPEEIEADHDELVKGLRKVAQLLEPLRKAAADEDLQAVKKAVGDIQNTNALKDAQEAAADMKEKGYRIGSLGASSGG